MNNCTHWYTSLHRHLIKLRCTCICHHFFSSICRICSILYMFFYFVDRLNGNPQRRSAGLSNSVCPRCRLICFEYVSLFTRFLLFRVSIDKRSILICEYFLFDHLVFVRITPLNVKLRDVHISDCLVEERLLVWTLAPVIIKLICISTTIHHKVIVCKPQSCCFEVTLLISVRTSACNRFAIIVICVVLSLSY